MRPSTTTKVKAAKSDMRKEKLAIHPNKLHEAWMTSPIGLIRMVSDGELLLEVQLGRSSRAPKTIGETKCPVLKKTTKQLQEYFAGIRKVFDLPLRLQGTAFQTETWRALQRIPYGEIRSYQEQARMIKRPKALRAVGRTNGLNPIGIIVPCHRVIGKSGDLTGYAGGLHIKSFLLQLEGVELKAIRKHKMGGQPA